MRNSTRSIEPFLQKDAQINMHTKSIVTQRLRLDAIRECDFKSLISILKHEVVSCTYMVPEMKSEDEEKKLFDAFFNLSLRQDRYVYGIFLDNQLIGIINDTEINGEMIEVGYALHPDFFSKGYMTEALDALINHLFTSGFDTVVCGAFEHNSASFRVMQKCGMSMIDKVDEIEYSEKIHRCIYYSKSRI